MTIGQKLKKHNSAKTLKKRKKHNTSVHRSLEAKYQRRRSDFLFMILLVSGSWMNFLSSNDIKQLSKQSQARLKPFISFKSTRLPPTNFPVRKKKSITTNNDDIIHEFWIRFLFFRNFSSSIVLWQLCLKFSDKSLWIPKWLKFDWINHFPWLYEKDCKNK